MRSGFTTPMSKLWFMPATPVLSERRHHARPADLVLPQRCAGFAAWHRRDVERERLARVQRRRHRHLLGPGALHRREGEGRRDLRHHSVHPRDGRPDARDQPGLDCGAVRRRFTSTSIIRRSKSFCEIRKASGDFNRKGLEPSITASTSPTNSWKPCAPDAMFALRSPKNNEVMREVNARQLWQRILETRLQTGRALSAVHRFGEPRAAESISANLD